MNTKLGKRQVTVLGFLHDEEVPQTRNDIVSGTGLTPNQVHGATRGLHQRQLIQIVDQRRRVGRVCVDACGWGARPSAGHQAHAVICIDAGHSMAEHVCDVCPGNLTLARAFVLRGLHRDCSPDECLVLVFSAGFIEDLHHHEPLFYDVPPDDGGEPLTA